MYITWYFGTLDLRERIANATKNIKKSTDDVQNKFEAIAKAVSLSVCTCLFFLLIYL
jgi:hypothetical protein